MLEIGPGTGQATSQIVAAGADVTAIEPDPRMAGALRQRLPGVRILESTAEAATVEDGAFDLVGAATSLHWLDRDRGYAWLVRALRPGGHLCAWWTVFSDPFRPDPVVEDVSRAPGSDVGGQRTGTGFQLDDAARREDLRAAGLVDVEVHRHAREPEMTPARTRSLFATLIGIIRLPELERTRVLDRIEAAAAAQPGGVDRRQLLTVLHSVAGPSRRERPWWWVGRLLRVVGRGARLPWGEPV